VKSTDLWHVTIKTKDGNTEKLLAEHVDVLMNPYFVSISGLRREFVSKLIEIPESEVFTEWTKYGEVLIPSQNLLFAGKLKQDEKPATVARMSNTSTDYSSNFDGNWKALDDASLVREIREIIRCDSYVPDSYSEMVFGILETVGEFDSLILTERQRSALVQHGISHDPTTPF